jgi:hypothetical protein
MVSALDQLKVAAGAAVGALLVAATPIVEASIDAKCAPAGMICGPATPVLPHGGDDSTPGRPPTTVQVLLTGTGTRTDTGPVPPMISAMQDETPYYQNHSAVWSSVR